MTVYRDDMAVQGSRPRFVNHGEGCEVITNSGDVKIVLTKMRVLEGGMEREFFSASYYIWEGGWLETNNIKTYPSREAFIQEVFRSDALTQAVCEIEKSKV